MEGPKRLKSERVVIFKHLFDPKEFEVYMYCRLELPFRTTLQLEFRFFLYVQVTQHIYLIKTSFHVNKLPETVYSYTHFFAVV